MSSKKSFRVLFAIVTACIVGMLIYQIFAQKDYANVGALFSLMTFGFILGLPFAVGYVTVYLCPLETVRNSAKAFFLPFIPIFSFFFVTLLFNLEGWACWMMVMPISDVGRHWRCNSKIF